GVDHKGADRESEYRVEPGLDIKDEKADERDQRIGDHQGASDIKAGIFFQDHGNDIGSAAGSADVEQDGGSERRKRDGKAELQHGLVSQRAVHGPDALHGREREGEQDAAVGCLRRKFFAENEKSDDQQEHACHKVEIAGGDKSRFGCKDRETGDPAEGKVVREFEEIGSERHDQRAEGQKTKISDVLFYHGYPPHINHHLSV